MLIASCRRYAAILLAALLVTSPLAAQAPVQVQIDYSKGRAHFPNPFGPYAPRASAGPNLTNSERLAGLIAAGKLRLSLQDAIFLALENNLDMAAQRFGPSIADTDILRAQGGAISRGAGGVGTASALGVSALPQLDPTISADWTWNQSSFPLNNTVTTGVPKAVNGIGGTTNKSWTGNVTYAQGFVTGTGFQVDLDNTRNSTLSRFERFNPSWSTRVGFAVQQPLLNGFGFAQNMRFIRVSKNNRQISDQFFAQQVMDIISNVKRAYYELIFAHEDVKVKTQSLALAQKLYNDNRRQVEIGTLAPIEVVRAESEVARNRQDLIVAQTSLRQQQTLMKDLLAKNPNDPQLALAEVEPIDVPDVPDVPEALPVQEAIQVAISKRPEISQSQLDLKNRALTTRAVRNALLPSLNFFASYSGRGLFGDEATFSDAVQVAGSPVVDATGTPVAGLFLPSFDISQIGLEQGGWGTSLTKAWQGDFPSYAVGLTLNIPLRNRAAQADMARAQIEERQAETRYQRLINSVVVEVRNAHIALEQNRARIDAALKSRQLFEETLRAEEKKFQLGASTIFQVIQAQRDLAQARSVEVRARVDFKRTQVDFDRALGRTLERSNVTMEEAKSGVVTGRATGGAPSSLF